LYDVASIYDDSAIKQLHKLDKKTQFDILRYMRERITSTDDPRRFGKTLHSDLSGLWRYRVGNYRIICKIENQKLVVLVVTIGHRKEVYD